MKKFTQATNQKDTASRAVRCVDSTPLRRLKWFKPSLWELAAAPSAADPSLVSLYNESVMSLSNVQEIERAIDALTPQQRQELLVWVDQHYPQPIDLQLQDDLQAGRFDDLIDSALADHQAGRTRSL